MKTLIILLLSIGSTFASEGLTQFFNSYHAQKICQNSVSTNGPNIYKSLRFIYSDKQSESVYFAFSKKAQSKITIVNSKNGVERDQLIEGRIKDILVEGKNVYYLTETTLYIADRVSGSLITKFRTLPNHMNYKKYAVARGLYILNNRIYIAHGEYGIMVFDKLNYSFQTILNPHVPQPGPGHRSMITDIVGIGNLLYFTYDDVTLGRDSKAFEGLMIWNTSTQSQHKLIPVNQRKEAYYQSNLRIDGDELVITNLHLNFRHKLKKLETDRYMRPLQRIWRYPKGKLVGRAFVNKGTLYGCFHDESQNRVFSGHMNF